MNASLAKQPPRELGRPIDLKRVEVCLDTGLPASPKCMLTSIADPYLPPRKGTFFEFSTAERLPNETCWLHGDDTRSFVRTLRSQDAPRALNANDSAQGVPVLVRAPTVLGDDPYQSVKPRPKEPPQLAQASKADWTPAPRALPVDKPPPKSAGPSQPAHSTASRGRRWSICRLRRRWISMTTRRIYSRLTTNDQNIRNTRRIRSLRPAFSLSDFRKCLGREVTYRVTLGRGPGLFCGRRLFGLE